MRVLKVIEKPAMLIGVVALSAGLAMGVVGCSSGAASQTNSASAEVAASSSVSATGDSSAGSTANAASATSAATATAFAVNPIGTVANTIAQDEDALVSTYASKFEQVEYTDPETGLSVTYNLFLPEGYDASQSYPMVVFIADSTSVGTDASKSLTQGLGALVWATDEWQAANPTIVCVPSFPETVLDDHNSYTTTEYVELTKRLIESVSNEYAVDSDRIYGTGQSMGCMTTLVLASEYPDLYAACMFVDGQWDVSALKGLEGQKFVYFAAEDDSSAYSGLQEVMEMFDADNVTYASAQWDGTWSPDDLSTAAQDLFAAGENANFITWKTGTIDASSASMGGSGGMGGSGHSGPSGDKSRGSMGSSAGSLSAGSASSSASGMGSVGYHMASFDYAYNCVAVMEWLFQQSK